MHAALLVTCTCTSLYIHVGVYEGTLYKTEFCSFVHSLFPKGNHSDFLFLSFLRLSVLAVQELADKEALQKVNSLFH